MGNAVTVALLGLQHEASATGCHADTLHGFQPDIHVWKPAIRLPIGSGNERRFRTISIFGSVRRPQRHGENYDFGSAFPGSLWPRLPPSVRRISFPVALKANMNGYATTGSFSSASTNFSAMFAGQPLAGVWRLDVADVAPGPTIGSNWFAARMATYTCQRRSSRPVVKRREESHRSFTQGQQNATYTLAVSNAANAGPTSGL